MSTRKPKFFNAILLLFLYELLAFVKASFDYANLTSLSDPIHTITMEHPVHFCYAYRYCHIVSLLLIILGKNNNKKKTVMH